MNKIKKLIKYFVISVLVIFICFTGTLIYRGYEMYNNALINQSLEDKVDELQSSSNYTTLSKIPKTYLNAIIAVEDHRFEKHSGIDLIGITRAIWQNINSLSLKEGGSTITQQLAKNMYFSNEKSVLRKIAEIFMAFKLENTYTKDEILELYANCIYFGDGYYCIKDASNGYFNKEPWQLNDDECTLLAGIPNAPSIYAPTKNPKLAKQRQEHVIKQMKKYGYEYNLENK